MSANEAAIEELYAEMAGGDDMAGFGDGGSAAVSREMAAKVVVDAGRYYKRFGPLLDESDMTGRPPLSLAPPPPRTPTTA